MANELLSDVLYTLSPKTKKRYLDKIARSKNDDPCICWFLQGRFSSSSAKARTMEFSTIIPVLLHDASSFCRTPIAYRIWKCCRRVSIILCTCMDPYNQLVYEWIHHFLKNAGTHPLWRQVCQEWLLVSKTVCNIKFLSPRTTSPGRLFRYPEFSTMCLFDTLPPPPFDVKLITTVILIKYFTVM